MNPETASSGTADKKVSVAKTTPAGGAAGLSPELRRLSKPARRALLAQGIRGAKGLAQ